MRSITEPDMPDDLVEALKAGGFQELTTARRVAFAVLSLPGRALGAYLRGVVSTAAILLGGRP